LAQGRWLWPAPRPQRRLAKEPRCSWCGAAARLRHVRRLRTVAGARARSLLKGRHGRLRTARPGASAEAHLLRSSRAQALPSTTASPARHGAMLTRLRARMFLALFLAGLPRVWSFSIQEKRVFMDNASVPKTARSGFHYPRYDARLHDGDEVQLQSVHKTWLVITDRPFYTLRGKSFALQEGWNGRFCAVSLNDPEGKIVCGQDSPPRVAWFEVAEAGEKVSLGLRHGKFCADRPEGIRCNTDFVGRGELFDIVDVGDGRIGLQGSRQGKFCADNGQEIVCDRDDTREHFGLSDRVTFRLVTDTELLATVVQTKDRSAASTFVVHREDIDSPMVALRCKGQGRFLMLDERSPTLSCSSTSPWLMASARAPKAAARWDMKVATFKATGTGLYLASPGYSTGNQVRLDSTRHVEWKVLLTGGCETLRPLVRGVNLGNWFLLEKWMAGYLFYDESGKPYQDPCDAMDEYGLMSRLGPSVARRRMEEHWSSWITEEDIAWMAGHGINAVRVPFGYWMVFPMAPFVPGQLKYLEDLFRWCEKHSIGVLLDFHGLMGSQTGNPTSGNCGACGLQKCGRTWLRFLEEQKVNLEVIRRLTVRFSLSPAYLGFAVANEVSGRVNRTELMAFYKKAYKIIRSQNRDALMVLYGAFAPSLYPWDNFRATSTDIHIYFGYGFGPPSLDQRENLRRARNAIAHVHWPVIVGEWSLAANGHPTLTWEPHRRDAFFDKFARMQLQAWETHSTGWFYWSYKTRFHNSTWNFRDMCEVGWLPGCQPELVFASAEWWKTPACAYAYMDGQCDKAAGLKEYSPVRWVAPLVASIMVLAATMVSIMIVKPGWVITAKGAADAQMKKLPWDRLPELPAVRLPSWDSRGYFQGVWGADVERERMVPQRAPEQ